MESEVEMLTLIIPPEDLFFIIKKSISWFLERVRSLINLTKEFSIMIIETKGYSCRKCQSEGLVKNGTNASGSSQYHCKACGA